MAALDHRPGGVTGGEEHEIDVAGNRPGGGVPSVRPDLSALSGYHSAQVDVEVRLNTNESPLEPPAEWVEAYRDGLAGIAFNRYPDRQATALRAAIAAAHGVDADQIFCANGSNEVLQALLLAYGGAGRTVALFEPTYTLHAHIARITGTAVAAGSRTDGFGLDLDEVRRTIGAAAPVITFLASPNNPTGRAEPVGTIEAVLGIAPGLLVVDEAYGQFAPSSALGLRNRAVPGGDRLVVVRTFSKTWAMAGVRLGYLVAHPRVVGACELVTLPYHLDSAKQLAGRLALDYADQMEARVALLKEERGRMARALSELPVESWPSDANFILFRPTFVPARQVWTDLVDRSVLVRDCSEWPGLAGCLRVTVGTAGENDRFLAALGESLR